VNNLEANIRALIDEIADLECSLRCAAASRRLTHETCATIRALVQKAMQEVGRD